MRLDRRGGNAIGGEAIPQPFGVVGQHDIGGIRLQKRLVVPRALRLFGVGHLQRAIERVRMRARENGERRQPLMMAVGEAPGDAAAPVVADQMKTRIAIARGRHDRHRIVHQAVDQVMRKFARIRPRARRIAALARCYGAIAHVAEGGDLRAPAMHRFRKAVQQQDQRRAGRAGGDGIEGEMRRDGDLFRCRHGAILDDRAIPELNPWIRPVSSGRAPAGIVQRLKSAVLEAVDAEAQGTDVALSEVDFFRCGCGDPDARHFAERAVHGAVQGEQRDRARGIAGLGQRHHVPDEVRGGPGLRVEGRENVPDGPASSPAIISRCGRPRRSARSSPTPASSPRRS